jgi:hypothetical protein
MRSIIPGQLGHQRRFHALDHVADRVAGNWRPR